MTQNSQDDNVVNNRLSSCGSIWSHCRLRGGKLTTAPQKELSKNTSKGTHMTHTKRGLFVYCVLSASFALVQDARSDDAIRGKFRLTASGTCTESIGGFTPRPTPQPFSFTVAYHEVFSATAVFAG